MEEHVERIVVGLFGGDLGQLLWSLAAGRETIGFANEPSFEPRFISVLLSYVGFIASHHISPEDPVASQQQC